MLGTDQRETPSVTRLFGPADLESYVCPLLTFFKVLTTPLRVLSPFALSANPTTTSPWLAVPLPGPGRCLKD
jgi:hypothetical protein